MEQSALSTRDHGLGLFADLYELTMAQAFYERRMFAPATFSLSVRNLPQDRGYLVSAGLEDVLDFLAHFQFDGESLSYLESTGIFSQEFLKYLQGLRFTGEVRAIPRKEGSSSPMSLSWKSPRRSSKPRLWRPSSSIRSTSRPCWRPRPPAVPGPPQAGPSATSPQGGPLMARTRP